MRRRRFIQALAAAPAAPAIAQQAVAPAAPPQAPAPRAAGGFRGAQAAAPLPTVNADLAAMPHAPSFFTPAQFAALRRLGGLLMPPLNGHPGALESGAAEFLDFLIGVSPADRQRLYRDGLDTLNAQAARRFSKPFADLDDSQADAVLRPMLSVIRWVEDLPSDPAQHFVAQAHRDFRNATENSREWAASAAASGRRGRGFGGGAGLYWLPIDPVKG